MVQSMTGFGSAQGQSGAYRWSVDIRSVNARGLDIRTRLPEGIEGLEKSVRDKVSSVAKRGNVSVGIRLGRDAEAGGLNVDPAKIQAALDAIEAVNTQAKERNLSLAEVRATDVLNIRGVMEVNRDSQPEAEDIKVLMTDIDRAVAEFAKMRGVEGQNLAGIIVGQVDQIDELTVQAKTFAGDRLEKVKAALAANLEAILSNTDSADPGRLETELAMIAVKADVTEELDRLAAHISAARELLAEKGPIGRKLDFLTQEFNREANTLCSKAQSSDLTRVGLDLKTVIDQMREQVQNVE